MSSIRILRGREIVHKIFWNHENEQGAVTDLGLEYQGILHRCMGVYGLFGVLAFIDREGTISEFDTDASFKYCLQLMYYKYIIIYYVLENLIS